MSATNHTKPELWFQLSYLVIKLLDIYWGILEWTDLEIIQYKANSNSVSEASSFHHWLWIWNILFINFSFPILSEVSDLAQKISKIFTCCDHKNGINIFNILGTARNVPLRFLLQKLLKCILRESCVMNKVNVVVIFDDRLIKNVHYINYNL